MRHVGVFPPPLNISCRKPRTCVTDLFHLIPSPRKNLVLTLLTFLSLKHEWEMYSCFSQMHLNTWTLVDQPGFTCWLRFICDLLSCNSWLTVVFLSVCSSSREVEDAGEEVRDIEGKAWTLPPSLQQCLQEQQARPKTQPFISPQLSSSPLQGGKVAACPSGGCDWLHMFR